MKYTIRHGAQFETVTPAEVEEIVRRSLGPAKDDASYRREKAATVLDGTGAGTITFKVPRLYDWICERVTCAAGAAGSVAFYENQVQDSDLLMTAALGATFKYSDAFSNRLFVPAGSALLVVFTGGGAAAQASVNLQLQMVRTKA